MTVTGVGIDIVAVDRFVRLVERGGRTFLDRWFRPQEVEWLLARNDPGQASAAQFAAKEAVLKALKVPDNGPVRWREIEITHETNGTTDVVLYGSILDLAVSAGVTRFHVALTGDHLIAVATTIAVSEHVAQPAL